MSFFEIPFPVVGSETSGTAGVLTTFSVANVLETVGSRYGVFVQCTGMDDDLCFGFVYAQDTSLAALLQAHMVAYDYLIVDGGGDGSIRLVRRDVNADLTIDGTIAQTECITRQPGSPAIKITRIDPMSIPRWIEIQYIDPDRNYAVNTQDARHIGAPVTGNKLTLPLSFVLSKDQARQMAFDVLYRLWAQQFTLELEHPDLTWEPGDCINIEMTAGQTYTVLITESLITKERTNQLKARQLLTSKGTSFTGGQSTGTFGTGTGA